MRRCSSASCTIAPSRLILRTSLRPPLSHFFTRLHIGPGSPHWSSQSGHPHIPLGRPLTVIPLKTFTTVSTPFQLYDETLRDGSFWEVAYGPERPKWSECRYRGALSTLVGRPWTTSQEADRATVASARHYLQVSGKLTMDSTLCAGHRSASPLGSPRPRHCQTERRHRLAGLVRAGKQLK